MNLTHAKLLELTRDTRKTLYVVSAAYVGVGFVLAVVCLATGQLLGTFLGFLIISGTLGAAAVLRAVLRVGVRVSAITEGLDDIRRRLDRVEASLHALHAPGADDAEPISDANEESSRSHTARGVLDLSRSRGAEPEAITAATLDRGVFPRLVSLLEQESTSEEHDQAGTTDTGLKDRRPATASVPDAEGRTPESSHPVEAAAFDYGDADARSDESTVHMEKLLRRSFADCVRRRDVAGLLEVTELVVERLPDHPMAAECRNLQPRLMQALAEPDDSDAPDDDDPPSATSSRTRHVAHATP